MAEKTMRLAVFTPAQTVFDGQVRSLRAFGLDGAFGILPRHIDFAAPLVAGVMSLIDDEGEERFIAVDGGVLLKIEDAVRVATRRAVPGKALSSLRDTVERSFLALSEHEKEARSAVARLEAGIVRRFLQFEELG